METPKLFNYFSLKEKGMHMMSRHQIMIPLFLFVLLFCTPSMAVGETVVLPEAPEELIDTYISSSSSWDSGSYPFTFAWSDNEKKFPDWGWAFSLVKFDLPPWLDTKHIVSARLEVFAYTISHSGVIVNVHRVSKPWLESSKWSDFPSLGNYPISQDLFDEEVENSLFPTAWDWMSFDVTNLVKDWISDPSSNYGVLLETPYSEVPPGESRAVGMFTSNAVGDYSPKLIIDYTETPTATIDFHPETLNLKSKGKWVTCYIELPEGYDIEHIEISTIAITSIAVNGEEADVIPIGAETHPTEVGDYDGDGIPDLMVKFDRATVQGAVQEAESLGDGVITLGFEMDDYDGIHFQGTDTLRVIDKGKYHRAHGDHGWLRIKNRIHRVKQEKPHKVGSSSGPAFFHECKMN